MPRTLLGNLYHKAWSKTWDIAHAAGIYFSPRAVFRHIYRNRTWGDRESLSGPGSDLCETEHLRAALPPLLKELGVRSMLDIPCGDFNWMNAMNPDVGLYIGAEVVPELVEHCREKYARPGREFRVLDITRDTLPKVDLIFCRDCLGHLSNRFAAAALRNIKSSGSTWLLITTYPGVVQVNRDIANGQFRKHDLTLPPFGLPPAQRIIEERSGEGGPGKSLGLWRNADVPNL